MHIERKELAFVENIVEHQIVLEAIPPQPPVPTLPIATSTVHSLFQTS